MKKTNTGIIVVLTGLLMVLFSLSVAAYPTPDNPSNLEVGHILAPETLQNEALKMLSDMVEERTNGALKIEVFPAQQLGSATDQLENVSMGAQSMMLLGTNWLYTFSERFIFNEVPFMFEDLDHMSKYYDEFFEDEMLPDLITNGNIRMINVEGRWIRSPYHVLISKKPVLSVDDLQGLSMRQFPSEAVVETWRRMGADISIIDYAEVYLALQYGTVESLTTPINLVYPQRFSEVAKFITETRDYPTIEALIINNDLWESLSSEQQKVLTETANEVGSWLTERVMDEVEELKQRMIDEHDAVYIEVNRDQFVEYARDNVFPSMVEDGILQQELVDEVLGLVE